MEPITAAALALSQFAPDLIKWFGGGDKAQEVAKKAVAVAQAVTGTSQGSDAIAALQASPDLQLKYRQAVLDQALEFERLAAQNAGDVNKTMQAEAAAEHWPTYAWRPFIGFCFGVLGVLAGGTAAASYLAVMFFHADPALLQYLPGMIGAEAGVMATMAPVLGIASWFRGRMQADPNIPTVNRG